MVRLDWKRGRWTAEVETQKIAEGLRGWQPAWGDQVAYFRWDYAGSTRHPVYDEAIEGGRVFHGPIEVPVLSAVHVETADSLDEGGFYTTDNVRVMAGFRQLARTGLTRADLHTGAYQRDRIAYDGLLFRVLEMRILGQIQRHDVTVEINAVQLKADEIPNDPAFAAYAVNPMALPSATPTGFGSGGYGDGPYGG
jgi:hypothetical protein